MHVLCQMQVIEKEAHLLENGWFRRTVVVVFGHRWLRMVAGAVFEVFDHNHFVARFAVE
jgi:hypothetical protein